MKYTCLNCNKVFSQKSNYDAHNNRKMPCNTTNDVKNILNNFPPNSAKFRQIPPNSAKLIQFTDILLTNKIIEPSLTYNNCHKCTFCYKTFTRKDSLIKHLNTQTHLISP